MKKFNWAGKNVLVTGGDGFIASHLVKRLQQLSANVIVSARLKKSKENASLLNTIFKNYPTVEYTDFISLEETQRIFDIHNIDTVFHLAATSLVVSAATSPYWALKNNIITTMNVLETARVNKVERIIIASTDKAYGDIRPNSKEQYLPYKEDYDLRGLDIYSVSKMCSDSIAQSYAIQFDMPIAITRSCNVFGPGDLNFSRIIPRSIIRLLNGLPPEINLGRAKALREYCFIDDVVEAYILLAMSFDKNKNSEEVKLKPYGNFAYNIGNYNNIDSNDIASYRNIQSPESLIKIISELSQTNIKPIIHKASQKLIEIGDQYNNSSKLFSLGYKPKYSLEEGLIQSIEWYKKHKVTCSRIAVNYLNQ